MLSLSLLFKSKFELIYSHDTGNAGLIGALLSVLFRKPLIVHIHGDKFKEISLRGINLLRRLHLAYEAIIEYIVLRKASLILFASKHILSEYSRRYAKYARKFKHLPVGIKLSNLVKSKEKERKKYKIKLPSDGVIIGYIGRLEAEKNLGVLLKALSLLKDDGFKFHLVIAGTGTLKPTLEEMASSLSIHDNVSFLGYVRDVKRILSMIDVFVLPSLSEGFPLALIEALASGKAIAASSIPQIRDIVRGMNRICLFNPRSVSEVKECIIKLSKLKDKAYPRHNVFEKYDISVIALKLLKLFNLFSS